MTDEQNVITGDGKAMSRIVAGVHGTPASDAALDWAAREARLRRCATSPGAGARPSRLPAGALRAPGRAGSLRR